MTEKEQAPVEKPEPLSADSNFYSHFHDLRDELVDTINIYIYSRGEGQYALAADEFFKKRNTRNFNVLYSIKEGMDDILYDINYKRSTTITLDKYFLFISELFDVLFSSIREHEEHHDNPPPMRFAILDDARKKLEMIEKKYIEIEELL